MAKLFRILAWVMTAIFVVFVVLPLIAERISISHEYKSLFYSFQLKDEQGKRQQNVVAADDGRHSV